MAGNGARFLRHSLNVIAGQNFRDFEVVVTDQSDDDAVAQVCTEFPDLALRHVWTRDLPKQGSANTNAAIAAAQGEVIKILFQDDYLNGPDALGQIAGAFDDPAVQWCLTGCDHSTDGETLIRLHPPRYHPQIRFGKNTVGSPSVLAVRRSLAPRFDENLIWLMDVDFYHQCAAALGPPAILSAPLVVTRLHAGQVSAGVSKALARRELRYVREKYADETSLWDRWHYLGRLRRAWI